MNGYTCVIQEKRQALRMALLLAQADLPFEFNTDCGSRCWFNLDICHEKAAHAMWRLTNQDDLWDGLKLKEPE